MPTLLLRCILTPQTRCIFLWRPPNRLHKIRSMPCAEFVARCNGNCRNAKMR